MTTSTSATDPPTADHSPARQARFDAAVEALTEAFDVPSPRGHRLDFAGFLADVLAAVAANVGGVHHLLARRPDSWEAGLISSLIEGTVGSDLEQLWAFRTAPVNVSVHIAELVEFRYGLPGISAARDQVSERYEASADSDPEAYDSDAYDVEIKALEARWRATYSTYGLAFSRAVHDRAALLAHRRVPVIVHVVDDPDACWWNQDDKGLNPHEDGDPLVLLLWEHAADTVPLPVDPHGNLRPLGNGNGESPAVGSQDRS